MDPLSLAAGAALAALFIKKTPADMAHGVGKTVTTVANAGPKAARGIGHFLGAVAKNISESYQEGRNAE